MYRTCFDIFSNVLQLNVGQAKCSEYKCSIQTDCGTAGGKTAGVRKRLITLPSAESKGVSSCTSTSCVAVDKFLTFVIVISSCRSPEWRGSRLARPWQRVLVTSHDDVTFRGALRELVSQ